MKKVLIVDDSRMITNALKILLDSEGIECEAVNEGAKVMDTLKADKFDLVVLDLMMPEVSGIEVFRMIKSNVNTSTIPVLVLTAKADTVTYDEDIKKCDKFMTKPFKNLELVSEIKKLLKI